MSLLARRRPAADVDVEAVRRAAGAVPDPELHLSLAEAGMLGDVTVDRAGGTAYRLDVDVGGGPAASEQAHEPSPPLSAAATR